MKRTEFIIHHVETEEAIALCHPVMVQLRPHLDLAALVEQAMRQMQGGYRMACAKSGGIVVGVAGYRILENLAWGRLLYVDDLVTDEAWRSRGVGGAVFDFLVQVARENACQQFHLDSGVQRHGAHRFYLSKCMDITCHHFGMKLEVGQQ